MTEVEKLEYEIMEKTQELTALRRKEADVEVPDYTFQTLSGDTSLSDLFASRDRLLVIHNMGQGCRYCTLWADGINGIIDHLENAMAVAMVSKDPPETQRCMALNRGWKFRLASHDGGSYMVEQCGLSGHVNFPGAAVYERKKNKIVRRGRTSFGPGDLFSPMWHFLSLAGIGTSQWTPQFQYWKRPEKLDDGGENILD